jgi:nitroimidazol reductase NimA-like FMN-containing flavoprotein (pyridoxamine 5'-phosphate oxidase superfamily)
LINVLKKHKEAERMDKPMRRSDRQLTDEETLQLFRDAEYGVLSVTDENNMPCLSNILPCSS